VDPRDVIDVVAALCDAYSYQGTAAHLDTARKLKRMCPSAATERGLGKPVG